MTPRTQPLLSVYLRNTLFFLLEKSRRRAAKIKNPCLPPLSLFFFPPVKGTFFMSLTCWLIPEWDVESQKNIKTKLLSSPFPSPLFPISFRLTNHSLFFLSPSTLKFSRHGNDSTPRPGLFHSQTLLFVSSTRSQNPFFMAAPIVAFFILFFQSPESSKCSGSGISLLGFLTSLPPMLHPKIRKTISDYSQTQQGLLSPLNIKQG